MREAMITESRSIKPFGLLMAGFLFALVSLPVAAESRFLSAIEDLPLMEDLFEIKGGVLVFDSPSGRIVEVLTMGKVTEEGVKEYYSQTLPQLGWTEEPSGYFKREGESLKLEFPQTLNRSTSNAAGSVSEISVLFMLSPIK